MTYSAHIVPLFIGELPSTIDVLLHVSFARAPLFHAGNGVAVLVFAILDDGENAIVLLKLDMDLVASRRRVDRIAVAKELGVSKVRRAVS